VEKVGGEMNINRVNGNALHKITRLAEVQKRESVLYMDKRHGYVEILLPLSTVSGRCAASERVASSSSDATEGSAPRGVLPEFPLYLPSFGSGRGGEDGTHSAPSFPAPDFFSLAEAA
jgi:hypothetical protein